MTQSIVNDPSGLFSSIYNHYQAGEREDGCIVELVKINLAEKARLYEVSATYASQVKPSQYYVVARNLRQARKKWVNNFSWLDLVSYIIPVDSVKSEQVLSDPIHNIIF